MKLLVIIPMYNARQFIVECLTSIISQNIPMRIIVVDDASTDGSSSLISQFKQVELLKNDKNMGTYFSINQGLKYASTDSSWTHYTIHGSDDVSLSNRFIKQLSKFNNLTLAVGCRYSRVDFVTNKSFPTNPNTNESVLIFVRKIFDTLGYYDSARAGCDTEYKHRLLLAFPKALGQVNEILIKSYLHSTNLTKKIPLAGKNRVQYVYTYRRVHANMINKKKFYRSF